MSLSMIATYLYLDKLTPCETTDLDVVQFVRDISRKMPTNKENNLKFLFIIIVVKLLLVR